MSLYSAETEAADSMTFEPAKNRPKRPSPLLSDKKPIIF